MLLTLNSVLKNVYMMASGFSRCLIVSRRAGVSLLDFMLYCVGKYLSMEMIADASDLKFYKNRNRIK